jgi:outer membrane protein OmpA-like peptidoglycan-associated protein
MLNITRIFTFILLIFFFALNNHTSIYAQNGYLHPDFKRDSDGDGVPDGHDKCPRTPKGEKVNSFGCPLDSDFDGIYDSMDKCVNVPGPKENFGCPWGDRDNDGIKDNHDRCPDVAGPVKFYGCPDTDGDGLPDSEDDCPKQAGPMENRGCPEVRDRDGDGLEDLLDDCPDKPGPKSNKGCPELSATDKAKVKEAFQNLLFETGKAIIKTSSYKSLNKLAEVLRDNPDANLSLKGHTDNVGDDDSNMTLSQNRANAVKDYLIQQGIDGSRITAEGFGETKPVADNNTPAGRTKNRRVEMDIKY